MSVLSTISVMVSSLIQNLFKQDVITDDKVVVNLKKIFQPLSYITTSVKLVSDLQSVSTEKDLGQVVEHLPPHGLVAVHVAGVAEHGLQHLSLLPHSS